MEIFDRTVSVECQGLKPDSMAFMREEALRQWKPYCATQDDANSYYL